MIDGQKVRNERARRGLTQREVSEISGITTVTISNVENGHRSIVTLYTLNQLAKALKVKPAELLR